MNKHNALTKLGLVPYSDTANIVSKCLSNTLIDFGENIVELFVGSLSQTYALPKEIVMLRYDIVANAIRAAFGFSADIVLRIFREELWQSFPSLHDSSDPEEITDKLRQIQEQEVHMFLQNLPQHGHVVFLYGDEQSKRLMLDSYFDSSVKGAKGVISLGNYKPPPEVGFTPYREMLNSSDIQGSMQRLASWIASINGSYANSQNPATGGGLGFTRIAGDENSWFLTNGFKQEITSLEMNLGPHLSDKMSILCIYHQKHLHEEEEVMKQIILSHGEVIVDQPLMLYARQQNNHDEGGTRG